jgi:hypothetical protein
VRKTAGGKLSQSGPLGPLRQIVQEKADYQTQSGYIIFHGKIPENWFIIVLSLTLRKKSLII